MALHEASSWGPFYSCAIRDEKIGYLNVDFMEYFNHKNCIVNSKLVECFELSDMSGLKNNMDEGQIFDPGYLKYT